MQEFTRTLAKLIGGQQNGRWVLIAGLVLVFLAALPDLIPTINALLGALPLKESTTESLRNGLLSVTKWSKKTRIVMGVIGVVLVPLGAMVVTTEQVITLPDERTTRQNKPVTFNVLTNDHDPDGSEIVLVSFTPVSANGGAVECFRDGGCTYTPAEDFTGDDFFTYNISYAEDKFIYGTLVTIHVVESLATPTWTAVPSSTYTLTSEPSSTATQTASATATQTLPPTDTPTLGPTNTPSDTSTPGPSPTPTDTTIVTDTPTPTATPTFTLTPSPTATEAPSPTPTVDTGEAYLTTLARLNVRAGPGVEYGYPLTALSFDTSVPIIGVSMDDGWWQIGCPAGIESPSGCWVSSNPQYSTAYNTEGVPVIPPPPTPTPAG
jgi:hypothetical protein